jgi:glycosyltransferase involved in cell wall biosynthesis
MTTRLKIALIMQGGLTWMGGAEYIKNLILALGSLPPDVRSTFELCLICSNTFDKQYYSQTEPHLDAIYYQETDLPPATLPNRARWYLLRKLLRQDSPQFSDFCKKQQIDFVYPYFSRTDHQQLFHSATWVADFQHRYLPQFFTDQTIKDRDQSCQLVAKYASSIVVSSKTAESDFHKFFPESINKTNILTFKTSPQTVWYEIDPQRIQQKYHLPNRFFLVSNQFWQHKNHLIIFEALKLLQEQSIYPTIVFTGHLYDYRQSDYSDIILQTIHKLGLASQVYLLGLIPKADQIQLIRHSLAVIQPSLFEGWSTLIEDVRCFGKPIILSNLSVHMEQNPPNSHFFERDSAEQLANLIAIKWEKSSPGPDLEQERIARQNNIYDVQAFGYRFLEIAKNC